MGSRPSRSVEERAISAAEAALRDHRYVSPLAVLLNMGLLSPNLEREWRQGRIDVLAPVIQGHPNKLRAAFDAFVGWARQNGMKAVEAEYLLRTREGTRPLRFTVDGDAATERFFRTHYLAADLSEKQQKRLAEASSKAPDLVVLQVVRDSKCSECEAEIETGDMLLMEAGQPLCLACAGLSDLEFLAAGDLALTRRTTKYTRRKAVVVRFSRSRNHYERQGILAELEAVQRAEQECAADADDRAAARARAAEARVSADAVYASQLAERLGAMFPGCPPNEVDEISRHTAVRGSGRVGRSAAAKRFDEKALTAAVIASIRHRHTDYDELLASGVPREEARDRVRPRVQELLKDWQS